MSGFESLSNIDLLNLYSLDSEATVIGSNCSLSPNNTIFYKFLYFTKGIKIEGSNAVGASSIMHILNKTLSKYYSKGLFEQLLRVDTMILH